MISEIPILYRDRDLIICVKPVGVDSQREMPHRLSEQLDIGEVLCVHRLDMGVGGLMVYGADRRAAAKLSQSIAEGKMLKTYLAVCAGRPAEASGTMRDLLFKDASGNRSFVVKRMRKGVREAELDYDTLSSVCEQGAEISLIKIRLHTGRSHQIRVQFSSRKMPLMGDGKYGSRYKLASIALWSSRLEFSHPRSNKMMSISCPPPEYSPWTAFPSELLR